MSEWWVEENDLKGNQGDVLDVDLDKNLAIHGPPGSGKTNLMMLRANHLHIAENSEFFVVSYTALLAEFLRRGASIYDFPLNKIVTQTKLFETILADHGCPIFRIKGESFSVYQEKLFSAINGLLEKGRAHNSFPALFIDEAQDYNSEYLEVFKKLAKYITLAADVRQGIYSSDDGLQNKIAEFCDPIITLKYHFRTGKAILKVADKIMEGKFGHVSMLDDSQYPEDTQKSTVELIDACSLNEQIDKAVERILKQVQVYPGELIGILVPRKEDLEIVWNRIQASSCLAGQITNTSLKDFDATRPVWLSTIHSAKGLEFRCAHIISAEGIAAFRDKARRLAFTAVTRAKTVLVVYHEKDLLPFLSAALKPGVDGVVKRAQLFGKKS